MKQNMFDLIMDYIDENIQKDTEAIKGGIVRLIGINSNTFGNYFSCMTGDTLGAYIRNRRLYHAATEIQEMPEKPICDIALEYGYSEQSSFTRAFSSKYGFSPGELRQKNVFHFLKNDKYYCKDFESNAKSSRLYYIQREIEQYGYLEGANLEFLEDVDAGCKEYGFDVDTGYIITELSERLDVPVCALMKACNDLVAEVKSDPAYLGRETETAITLDISPATDLQEICEYYACKYYELNRFMVENYYEAHRK